MKKPAGQAGGCSINEQLNINLIGKILMLGLEVE